MARNDLVLFRSTDLSNLENNPSFGNVSRPNSLKLDLPTAALSSTRNGTALSQLNSPDFRTMVGGSEFFMASPGFGADVEKFMTQLNTMSPQTPTSFLNPKIVTFDQEQFANYFTKKITEIKEEREGVKEGDISDGVPQLTDISYSAPSTSQYHQVEEVGLLSQPSTTSLLGPSTTFSLPQSDMSLDQFTYPKSTGPGSTVSSSEYGGSADLNSKLGVGDTHQKLERKRARNRDAARKCRERKLALIEKLEKEKAALVEQNKTLSMKMKRYQGEVQSLKRFVIDHVSNGCKIAKMDS